MATVLFRLFTFTFYLFAFNPIASADLSESRRTAIVTAVEAVLPATVTIGAEKLAVREVNPFRSLHDDFFSDWFADPFFGGFRETVRVKSLGSGIIVSDKGLILTNDHVVADAEDIRVTLSDGRTYRARLKGRGLPLDLAILEILLPNDAREKPLPYATLGTASDLALGEWAIAIGAPSNLEASVTAGVVSAVGRRLPAKQDYRYFGMIQTDASINPGNSGGPLVNADGKIVGINTVIISQSGGSEGLGFAIPADQARKALEDILAAGELRVPWFGWDIAESKTGDLVVKRVYESSDAAAEGVNPGAVLTSLNGRPVRNADEYEQALMTIRIGQPVGARLTVAGVEQTARLTARPVPEFLTRVDLGLEVQNVSERFRRQSGGGVVVRDIRPDGFFGRMEASPIVPGDIIVAIGDRRIDSVEAYEAILKKLKKNRPVDFTIRRQNYLLKFTVKVQ